jgi:hypothetical protein
METSKWSAWRRRPGAIAAMVLGSLATVNALQVEAADNGQYTLAKAWNRYDYPDVFAAALIQDPNARSRYDIYLALSQIAPGSVVVIPERGAARSERPVPRFYAFGTAEKVMVTSDDASGLGELALERGVLVASGPGGSHGAPWVILVDSRGDAGRGIPVLDLYGTLMGTASAPVSPEPRTWLWLSAFVQPAGSDYYSLNVLVEASAVGFDVEEASP